MNVAGVLIVVCGGATQTGHCRLRDLVPDTAAAMLGTVIVLASQRVIDLISSRAGGNSPRANTSAAADR